MRASLGGTVNDVVLTAITSGFRDLLVGRGDPVDDVVVRTLVPVSVRSGDDRTLNNQVSGMIAELPVGIVDPLERLAAIRAQMQDLKESHQADAGKAVNDLASFAPPALLGLGLRTATAVLRRAPQRSVNTVTTNVPGPQIPLYACGREMLEYFPFVPISHGVRTGVAILSYNRKVSFGITADWDSVHDIDVLAEGIEAGMAELLSLAAATPARRRRGRPRCRRWAARKRRRPASARAEQARIVVQQAGVVGQAHVVVQPQEGDEVRLTARHHPSGRTAGRPSRSASPGEHPPCLVDDLQIGQLDPLARLGLGDRVADDAGRCAVLAVGRDDGDGALDDRPGLVDRRGRFVGLDDVVAPVGEQVAADLDARAGDR